MVSSSSHRLTGRFLGVLTALALILSQIAPVWAVCGCGIEGTGCGCDSGEGHARSASGEGSESEAPASCCVMAPASCCAAAPADGLAYGSGECTKIVTERSAPDHGLLPDRAEVINVVLALHAVPVSDLATPSDLPTPRFEGGRPPGHAPSVPAFLLHESFRV
jgi:hypothetical protein